MTKDYVKPGWFQVSIPDSWEVDEDETPVAIYDPNGAGALQLSVETPRPLKPGERIDGFLFLRGFLRSVGVDLDESAAARTSEGGLEWASYEYVGDAAEGAVFWRLWFATNHDVLAFLTYACPAEEKDAEREAVTAVVKSLVLF